jgi:F-type H+-transporting ATPase subunit delta
MSDVGLKFAEDFSKLTSVKGEKVANQFFAFAVALHESKRLTRALTDYAKEADSKRGVIAVLAKSIKADKLVEDVMVELASKKWSKPRDLFQVASEFAFSTLMISLSKSKDTKLLENVEANLFKLEEQMKDISKHNNDLVQLRDILSSESRSLETRFTIVDTLIGKKADAPTLLLAKLATLQIRGASRYVHSLKHISDEIARARGKKVVDIIAAAPLTAPQLKKLESHLQDKYNAPVQMNIVVKPAMLGGLRIEVDGDVFDTTILHSLNAFIADFELEFRS